MLVKFLKTIFTKNFFSGVFGHVDKSFLGSEIPITCVVTYYMCSANNNIFMKWILLISPNI